ncbi:MAG: alpha-hydroxy-acid oxidizing protein [Actinobacteria bacterium]|nr:alpha-hydroxy-acid oxidizing protein [Actinomycetota bacterium]
MPLPRTIEDFRRSFITMETEGLEGYVDGGSGRGITAIRNVEAWDAIELLPHVLAGSGAPDTATSLLDAVEQVPLLVAPTGFQEYVHPDGGRAVPRACAAGGVRYTHSTFATSGFADLAAIDDLSWWFQLYVFTDTGLNKALMAKAAEAGASAIVMTVDLAVLGQRDRDLHTGFSLRGRGTVPCAVEAGATDARLAPLWSSLDHDMSWDTLTTVVADAPLPVIVKGLVRADDAIKALDLGAAGVIVSNHGGRQLDTSVATARALPAVVDAVAGRGAVLVDGGIRTGLDVAKALALGADAALVGRAPLWGLGVGGEQGVAAVLRILREEFERSMTLLGARSIAGLTRDLLY